jgi:ABC-type lipoprotein release transport system permease subunit
MARRGEAEVDEDLKLFRDPTDEVRYSRARVYVKDVFQLIDMHERLSKEFVVSSDPTRVKEVQNYRRDLDFLVSVLSLVALVIAVVTVCVVFFDIADRKKGMVGVLRIMGITGRGVRGLLVVRGFLVAVVAVVILAGCGPLCQWALNLYATNLCILSIVDYSVVTLGIVFVCLLGTIVPAWKISRIDPLSALDQAQNLH